MIYATVGTLFLDFPRLIRELDRIAEETGEEVVVQTGLCTTLPKHCSHFDFKGRDAVLHIQRRARVIVSHAGIGSVIDALQARRPLIVVPRLKRFREHLTDHQLEIASAVERRGWGRMVCRIEDLASACANPPLAPESYAPAKHRLIAAVREAIAVVAAEK